MSSVLRSAVTTTVSICAKAGVLSAAVIRNATANRNKGAEGRPPSPLITSPPARVPRAFFVQNPGVSANCRRPRLEKRVRTELLQLTPKRHAGRNVPAELED